MATAAEIVGVKLPDDAGEDSVSIVSELLGTAQAVSRKGTVHQSAAGDVAIRQGPWKLVILKSGKRELYHIESDIGETRDVLAMQEGVARDLAALMESMIELGRSTPGASQKNGVEVALPEK
jgi:hypothetical protein